MAERPLCTTAQTAIGQLSANAFQMTVTSDHRIRQLFRRVQTARWQRSSLVPENNMNNEVTSTIGDVASRAQDKASELGHRASEFGHKAVGAIDAQRGSAANGLDSAAAGIHANADKVLPTVSAFAHQAADKLGASADYVRGNKLSDMMSDLGNYVKANPGPALIGALVIGFCAGRMLRRN
jgi:hypothetical protein